MKREFTPYFERRTKIICTIGPASGSPAVIERLIKAGMNIARLNLSHGTYQEHAHYVTTIKRLSQRLEIPVSILMDLPGPKYRTGSLKGGSVILKEGSRLVLTTRGIEGDEDEVPVNLPTLPQDARAGDTVLLDDGAMELEVLDVEGTDVKCRVVRGGSLTSGRGIVIPGSPPSTPFITDKLKEQIDFVIEQKPDYIALSFVSGSQDVKQVKELLEKRNSDIPIISKIELGQAVINMDEIMSFSEGLMVARGDLGVDIPLQKIPLVQKDIIRKCNQAGKPVITSTQMLESMVGAARPTRAEVTDVANAIYDGSDALMLSSETSIGKYPVQAVEMMDKISRETESKLPYESMLAEKVKGLESQTDEAISYDACRTAQQLGARAIVAFTRSGSTARRVSRYRPSVPILAITPFDYVLGRLMLYWGVYAFQIEEPSSIEELFLKGAALPKELGLAKSGDLVIITGGIPMGVSGTTNLLKVERIS